MRPAQPLEREPIALLRAEEDDISHRAAPLAECLHEAAGTARAGTVANPSARKLLSADWVPVRCPERAHSLSATDVQSTERRGRQVSKSDLVDVLTDAREQTRQLLAPLEADALSTQHSELMSPLVWDLAHIGWYEEYWLLRSSEPTRRSGTRSTRSTTHSPIQGATGQTYLSSSRMQRGPIATTCASVRSSTSTTSTSASTSGCSRAGTPMASWYSTSSSTRNDAPDAPTARRALPLARSGWQHPGRTRQHHEPREVTFDGGIVTVGSDHEWAYDNETPIHPVTLSPFAIDVMPATNGDYQAFIADGGYTTECLWSQAGWRHICSESIDAPLGWARAGAETWTRCRLGNTEPVPATEPVQHVSWFEADAFARWAGKRLPSELEWEVAASWDPSGGQSTTYPWGNAHETDRANLGRLALGPSELGSVPSGASWLGCEHMTGDVWEWTSSDFRGYENFEPFPYPEYSEAFFGSDYRFFAAVRGRRARWSPELASATGTSPYAVSSLPACAAPATSSNRPLRKRPQLPTSWR